jgi:hypothetical protein
MMLILVPPASAVKFIYRSKHAAHAVRGGFERLRFGGDLKR